jgi:hypothetical protein
MLPLVFQWCLTSGKLVTGEASLSDADSIILDMNRSTPSGISMVTKFHEEI